MSKKLQEVLTYTEDDSGSKKNVSETPHSGETNFADIEENAYMADDETEKIVSLIANLKNAGMSLHLFDRSTDDVFEKLQNLLQN